MFDFAWSEFALIGAVALVVIGPKDLPVAIRGLAKGIKKARALASEFQSHLDEVVREADLSDVRDHVRDLKNLNVRGRIMKALDGDGSLGKAVSPPPMSEQSVPSGPRALDGIPRSASPTYAAAPQSSADYAAGHMGDAVYGSAPIWNNAEQDRIVQSAPPELPPLVVRRILREQDRLHPPAIMPPVRIMHAGHRVAPSVLPSLGALSGEAPTGANPEALSPAAPPSTDTLPAGPSTTDPFVADPCGADPAGTAPPMPVTDSPAGGGSAKDAGQCGAQPASLAHAVPASPEQAGMPRVGAQQADTEQAGTAAQATGQAATAPHNGTGSTAADQQV